MFVQFVRLHVCGLVIPSYEFDVALCGFGIVLCESIITLRELAVTFLCTHHYVR